MDFSSGVIIEVVFCDWGQTYWGCPFLWTTSILANRPQSLPQPIDAPYLVSWDLPVDAPAAHRLYDSLQVLSSEPEICHLEGDDRLYPPEQQIIEAGVVEI